MLNNHNFNYGDFILYVSNDFCIPHGFYFDDALYPLEDDFNTILAKPKEEDK